MKTKISSLLVICLCVAASCTKKETGICVQSVTLDSKSLTVYIGESKQLTAKILPDNATDKTLIWESQFPAVAAVSSTGEVTGRSLGTSYVTVKSTAGSASDICTVTVSEAPVAVTSISLDKSEISINGTQSVSLNASILPANATNKSVTWNSDDTEIAVVSSSGVVSGVDEGVTTVTATTVDGGFKAACKVTVTSTRVQKRPSGGNWTRTEVPGYEGIVLYHYEGQDGGKTYRNVNVVDIDTSRFSLKFHYDGSRYTTSQILSKKNAVVAMNGAYETASIYIKIGGYPQTLIENDEISDTKVANWKNDGAVCLDKKGNISFLNTIFRTADSKGSGSYGLSLKSQRDFYRSKANMSGFDCAFSSAPLMIYKYSPVGLTFVPSGQSYYDSSNKKSEDPYYHQSQPHPRTVIAMDCKGHLLMITADGRQTERVGYSCKDLTQFLVDNFDPKFALNMDGGGSTTLCIAGMGKSDTHVVNHPIDDNVVDKERTVSSFFYVVKK